MKKGIKKLKLSKMTISNLNVSEMSQKVGGISTGCFVTYMEKKSKK